MPTSGKQEMCLVLTEWYHPYSSPNLNQKGNRTHHCLKLIHVLPCTSNVVIDSSILWGTLQNSGIDKGPTDPRHRRGRGQQWQNIQNTKWLWILTDWITLFWEKALFWIPVIRGGADKSLARPGSEQATVTKLGIYSTYSPWSSIHFLARCSDFCKPLKKKIQKFVHPMSLHSRNDLCVRWKMVTFQLFFQSRE